MMKTPRSAANVLTGSQCAAAALTALLLGTGNASVQAQSANAIARPFQTQSTAPAPVQVASASDLTIQSAFAARSAALNAVMAGGAKRQVTDVIPTPFPIALRLGAMLSPRTKFAGGIDATIPGLSAGPGFSTRADIDAIVSANFGGITTLVPLTLDEIYSKGLVSGTRIYGGLGIGPYFGEVTRFGGKIIFGADITRSFGLEGNVHFAGQGDALFTLQARFRI